MRINMPLLRCPVCRADNSSSLQCRRCKADLSLLWQLEEQREAALSEAASAVQHGAIDVSLAFVDAADAVRSGSDTAKLRAICHLFRRDFAAVWSAVRTIE
jgi:hypothetical protein